jgi:hypothetical protein
MRTEETLDEAIDRVASHMTRSDPNVDLAPVWVTPAPRGWIGWRVAGGVGLAVALLSVALTIAQRDGRADVDAPVDSSPLVAWSSFHAPVSEVPGTLEGSGTPKGVPYVPTRASIAAKPQTARVVDEDERPTWGIPLIGAPTALAIAAPTRISDIDVDTVAVDAIEVAPLLVGAIDPNGARDSKEQ